MLNITLDLDTGLAKLAAATTIKAGAQVPVTITTLRGATPTSPGASPAFELGLGTDATPPLLKAYLATFAAENAHTFTGVLDANDARLIAFMAGKGTVNFGCEVAWTVTGELQVAPSFTVPVQSRVISGPASSETGPDYYTEAEVDALLAGKVADNAVVKLTGDQTVAGAKTFSSSPILPTPTGGDNSTKGATTAFVTGAVSAEAAARASAITAAINALVNGAPGALDTLKELADQLGSDESAIAALTNALAAKATSAALDALAAIVATKSTVFVAQRSIGKYVAGSAATVAVQTNDLFGPVGMGATYADHSTFTVTRLVSGVAAQSAVFEMNNDGAGVADGNIALTYESNNGLSLIALALLAALNSYFAGSLIATRNTTYGASDTFTVATAATGSAQSLTITDGNGWLAMSASGTDAVAPVGATYRKLLAAPGAGKQWRVLVGRFVTGGGFAAQWTTAKLCLVLKEAGGTLHPLALLDANTMTLATSFSDAVPHLTNNPDYDGGLENLELGIATVDPSNPAALLAEPVGDDIRIVVDVVKAAFPNTESSD